MSAEINETNISKVYEPEQVEKKWYKFWEENKLFHQEVDSNKKPYSIVIPPPNVTGQLHMGHALDNTLQDILIRFRRMQGYNTLWMPGTDHAGIATQIKVEEELRKSEQLTRYDLGRENFIERVWAWKEQYGNRIINQLKSLGASCDWSRERFTMDEGCSKAVREVFVSLYEQGLIYQGSRITNWCVRCNTALSDIEVEHEEQAAKLWHVRYKVVGENNEYVTIATTRPETILGDTAVAVNPEDERYRQVIGKKLLVPIVNREIPIIEDSYVDPSFGTGAVKVTPAHDPNDFDMGERHKLEHIVVIAPDGKMTEIAGKYQGQDRYECRKNLIADIEAQGDLVKIIEHQNSVGHCQRCNTVVEPLVSKQWFVKMQPLVAEPLACVQEGEIKFVPERFSKTYTSWLENIRDWCISRQIWWGHRIPAWYCSECGETIVSRVDITSCPKCSAKTVKQDEDVLDTWFSSALWPFSTMGWPENTPELKQFYPTSVLVTGYDIIFFWVARMVVMGRKFMEEIPFKHVFIHGLVRDSQGRKMSKSLGNGIDPLEVIEKYGADTLRFTLITGNTPGNDMRFYWERVESSRNFANKIWNASRFTLMNIQDYEYQPQLSLQYTLADSWILSRLNTVIEETTRLLENFELGEAGKKIYDFIWSEFCDWYIELAKARLYNKEDLTARYTAQTVLKEVLGKSMQLLHPFMPFITEEIWQYVAKENISIMISEWPEVNKELIVTKAEADMNIIMDSIKAIRNIRAEMNIPLGKKNMVIIQSANQDIYNVLEANQEYFKSLASVEELELSFINETKPQDSVSAILNSVEIYLPLKGLLDVEKEVQRLNKELENMQKEVSRLVGKLNNAAFLAKAPEDIVEKEQEKLKEYQEKYAAIEERINYFKNL